MDVTFPYKDKGIGLKIPADVDIFHPPVRTPSAESYHAIIKNLLRPLGYKQTLFDMAKKCKTACLVVDAFCPPDVNRKIVDPIIKTLHAAGMSHDDITILVTSEYPAEFSEDKIKAIFDDTFRSEYNVQLHKIFSYTKHELIGSTEAGTPVFVDRRLKEAEIKIVTGNIYPHYLFGYSGAPLLLTLGLSGPETIQNIYNLSDIDHLEEFWLLDENSKLYKELHEIFRITKLDFIVNVTIDRKQQIIDIFSGKPDSVVQEFAKVLTSEEFSALTNRYDIVISSPGGSHLEPSWYHNLMGLCFAHSFLQPNGTIIFVTPIFEQFSNQQLNAVKRKADLIELFSLEKVIKGTRAKMFSCMDDGRLIVVSPHLDNRSLKSTNRTVYFCSSIETALNFAKEQVSGTPHTLLLPDGLQTFVRLQS